MTQKRVLIVDDEETARQIALFDLDKDYDCVTASDAFDAYEKICCAANQNKPFDVIVLDEIMPEMNGSALLKIIRISEKYNPAQVGSRTKFAIVSGVESKKLLQNLYKTVIRDRCVYLKKPFERKELKEMVKKQVS